MGWFKVFFMDIGIFVLFSLSLPQAVYYILQKAKLLGYFSYKYIYNRLYHIPSLSQSFVLFIP